MGGGEGASRCLLITFNILYCNEKIKQIFCAIEIEQNKTFLKVKFYPICTHAKFLSLLYNLSEILTDLYREMIFAIQICFRTRLVMRRQRHSGNKSSHGNR